jgi:hypothetical protein
VAVRESGRVPRQASDDLIAQARAYARFPISLTVAWEFGELLRSANMLPDVSKDHDASLAPPRFREIARHLEIEKTKFWRIVQLHATLGRLPWLRACHNVRSAHVHAVRGLPLTQQNALLHRVEEERWTCRELLQVIRFGDRSEEHAFVTSLEAVCAALTQATRHSAQVGSGADHGPEVLNLLNDAEARWRELGRATAPLRARLVKATR